MTRVAFHTLGCKSNQYDTQSMREAFARAGYAIVDFDEMADIYLINTCTVTATGDQKSRQSARKAHAQNPQALVVMAGCFAQRAPQEALAIEGVGLVVGPAHYLQIVDLAQAALSGRAIMAAVSDIAEVTRFDAMPAEANEGKTRAVLKIQDGCNNRCSYCIIPSVRGPIRSLALPEIVSRAREIAQNGYLEIVLTGIHLSSYGRDLGEGYGLIDVLEALDRIEGLKRIRLGSLEAGLIDADFCARIAKLQKLCPQFHLSLQSGSGVTLAAMHRRYTTAQYAKAVADIRAVFPLAAITTDIICGFPGESQADHQTSMDFAQEIGFARIHVFPYSRRTGTPAAEMPGQIDRKTKNARAAQFREIAPKMEADFQAKFLGQTVPVLYETGEDGGARGLTAEYIEVYAKGDGLTGKILPTRLTALTGFGILGEIVDCSEQGG